MRYEIADENSSICIAYGVEREIGTFLAVYDRRLQYSTDAKAEVNNVAQKVGEHNGGGYLELHTGINGFGKKVNSEAMAIFMARFGVPQEHIHELLGKPMDEEDQQNGDIQEQEGEHQSLTTEQNCTAASNVQLVPNQFKELEVGIGTISADLIGKGPCAFCAKGAKMRCKKCWKRSRQEVIYCTKECQKADWNQRHKYFCSLPLPAKKFPKESSSKYSVYGLLLPANEKEPEIVEIVVNYCVYDGDIREHFANVGDYLGEKATEQLYMIANPKRDNRPFEGILEFKFRIKSKKVGAQKNACIGTITGSGKECRHPLSGPILVMKKESSYPESSYADIGLSDGGAIVDFFKAFGRKEYGGARPDWAKGANWNVMAA